MKVFAKYKLWLILSLVIFVIFPLVWLAVLRFEGEPPVITGIPPVMSIGEAKQLSFSVSDKSGIRKVRVSLVQDGKDRKLLEKGFPPGGFGGAGLVRRETVDLSISPGELGLAEGRADLQVVVRDYSWRNFWKGNALLVEKPVLIDTQPPEVEVLTKMHYINQGGCGLVIYRLSENCPENGVMVGSNLFPAYTGYFDDDQIQMAFFAVNYNQGPETRIYIRATDQAGNMADKGFHYRIRSKRFRKDRLNVSDGFLNMKMPEFDVSLPDNPAPSNLEKYLFVNSSLRKENYEELVGITSNAKGTMLWKGAFLRFPNSASRARYADFREYYYKGKKVDEQVHLGIDLAAVAQAPVPAGNHGDIVFADKLGIYGKTVLIDHGYGLFSMYSHLSQIDVNTGDNVSRGDIIGKTGMTGLAAGDHLHYAVMLHNTFVNPIEWWDGHWIKDNISRKIGMIKSGLMN